ncbi:MAG: T9SS type A sorting domain-containing protein [Ignavibacteria bacterium]|nr:T9SS type A sorting domain-containing protein [Ignavibacteria bacterium]
MTSFKAGLSAAALLLLSSVCSAQWVQTGGPRGWTLTAMAERQGVLFAGTWEGAVFRSEDNGRHWAASCDGLPASGIGLLRFEKGTLFACTNRMGGLFLSRDFGTSWIRSMPDSIRPETMAVIDGRVFVAAWQGVFASSDDGRTWRAVKNGLPEWMNEVSLAAVGQNLFLACDSRLYRNTDAGAKWLRADSTLPGRSVDALIALGPVLVVANRNNVYRSVDGAAHWTASMPVLKNMSALWSSGSALYASDGAAVHRSADSAATWLAAPEIPGPFWTTGASLFFPERLGVRRSDDGGATWTTSECAPIGTLVEGFAVSGNAIAVTTMMKEVSLSLDNGEQWTPFGTDMSNYHVLCMAFAGRNLLAGGTCTSGGIDLTDNNGASWTRVSDTLGSLSRIQAEAFAVRGHDVYAAGNGIWKSGNDGRSWSSCSGAWGSPPPYFNAMVFLDSTLCAAGEYFTRSTDGGLTWTSIDRSSPSNDFTTMTAFRGMLCAGRWKKSPLRSSDRGDTWQEIGGALSGVTVNAFASDGAVLFAATEDRGVFISEDTGSTWAPVSRGLPQATIRRLIVHDGFLFAGTASFGVWRCALSDLSDAAHPPVTVTLEQNYPNPFNAMTVIRYGTTERGGVTLRIHDVLGKEVETLVEEEQASGMHVARFDAKNLPSGTYRYRLTAGGTVLSRSMTVVR